MLNEMSNIPNQSGKSRTAAARCPVCGMQIDEKTARIVEYQGQAYVVASDDCKAKFQANPEKYTGKAVESAGQHSHHGGGHGCC